MKAYLVDPFEKSISEFKLDFDGDYGTLNSQIHKAIHVQIFTLVAFNKRGDHLFVDDNGLFMKPDNQKFQSFFQIADYPQPLAGYGLALGSNEHGESQSVVEGFEKFHNRIAWR